MEPNQNNQILGMPSMMAAAANQVHHAHQNSNNNLTLGELLSKQRSNRSSIDNSSIVVVPGGENGDPEGGTPQIYPRRTEVVPD